MALELAKHDACYEDMASKFFEHFIAIADAMNTLGGTGLWSEDDGFYYDELTADGTTIPLRVRSLVGLMPLIAVEILEQETIDRLPGFAKRARWFLEHRSDLAQQISYMRADGVANRGRRLLSIPSRERLERMLRYVFDENEFLSPFGIRSLSRAYESKPYEIVLAGRTYSVGYSPAEATTSMFGGNSNWRGPVWFPINFLIVEALERYHHFYGDGFTVELPTGSGRRVTLDHAAREIARRLVRPFLPDERGRRPCHGDDARYADDEHWKELVLFHEYFHAETGRGVGASHQTGWTSLAALLIEDSIERSELASARGESPAIATAPGA
jgi:hypothetical protein